MRESGCAQVLIGLESPTESGLGGLERRSDWKLSMFPHYYEAISAIQSRGITVNGCFVLGLDGHTRGVFDEVFRFVKNSGLYEVQVTLLTAFPGTPLYSRLESEGRLLEPENWNKCTLFDINFIPSAMTVAELDEGFKKLAVELYSEDFTSWRRERFRKAVRAQRRTDGA